MAPAIRNERLDVRISSDLKRTIEHAAALTGQSLSDFILGIVTRRARKIIREAEVIRLTDQERDRFLAALDNPPAPNEALLRAAERYKATVKRG
jgi:uncharacterized protein (DUF1778 family)